MPDEVVMRMVEVILHGGDITRAALVAHTTLCDGCRVKFLEAIDEVIGVLPREMRHSAALRVIGLLDNDEVNLHVKMMLRAQTEFDAVNLN